VSARDPDPGTGMNIPDHFSESLETVFVLKILKFFDADPGSGIFLILDPVRKNSVPGSGINIKAFRICSFFAFGLLIRTVLKLRESTGGNIHLGSYCTEKVPEHFTSAVIDNRQAPCLCTLKLNSKY
jgi:hypothetical protein